VHGLIEVDVTRPRQLIRQLRARSGERLSLTGFVAACVARAVAQHPEVHAVRSWRGNLIVFRDVDISLPIEHDVEGLPVGTPYVVRAANRKTLSEIHAEIRAAQAAPPPTHRHHRLYARLPGIVRRGFWWVLLRSPIVRKRVSGTVGLTAVGMFGAGGGWGAPLTGYSLQITLGGISERPALAGGRIETREYLGLTITVDHDVIDGAPAARFARTLRRLIEGGEALEPPPPDGRHEGIRVP
jgi:pyruvate/2-oxoglutarate dehydrogenase complex dihydrolipoamide acyltransferase (E2) component